MQITPHISFDGNCKEAFLAYQRILGGTITTLMTYGESPMAAQVDAQWHDRIVHASLKLGEFELAGADALTHDFPKPQGFSIILNLPDLAEGQRIFAALAEGGAVHLPFQATFWSPGFGVLVDRFNVPWEINCAADQS